MVITSCTRNAVVELSAHGFESHLLRQQKAMIDSPIIAFCFVKKVMGFERVGIASLRVYCNLYWLAIKGGHPPFTTPA